MCEEQSAVQLCGALAFPLRFGADRWRLSIDPWAGEHNRAGHDRLRQGLLTGATRITREAQRVLFGAAPGSITYIMADLRRLDFGSVVGRGETGRLAVGLAALLHDLDEHKLKSSSHPLMEAASIP